MFEIDCQYKGPYDGLVCSTSFKTLQHILVQNTVYS